MGEVFNFEAVVVVSPFAAIEDLFGNLPHGEVGEGVGFASEGAAQHEEAAIVSHFFGELGELVLFEGLGGDVEEVAFGGVALLPIVGVGGGVGEAFEFAEGFGQHGGVVGFVDDPVAPLVLLEEGGGEVVVAEAAAALPVCGLGDAAFVVAVDDFLEAGDDVGVAVFAEFDHDPAAIHFVGDCACGAGTCEGVEDEIVGVGGNFYYLLNESLWLWCDEIIS